MLARLIRKEILESVKSSRYVILAGGGALVIWLSLYSGATFYGGLVRDHEAAQAATRERIEQLQNADLYNKWRPWEEYQLVSYLHNKPPPALGIFVRGLTPYLGRSATARSNNREIRFSPSSTDPLLGVFLPLDLGLVVQVVLSLFALLICYDAFCGEKEGGTLRLVSSYSLPRDRLLAGKLLGALLSVLLAFGPPLLIGIAVVLVMPGVELTTVELERLGLILLTFGVYLAAASCLGLLASSLTTRPATSFVVVLASWVGAVVLVPSLSMTVAGDARPAMTYQEYRARLREITKNTNEEQHALMEDWEARMAREHGTEWLNSEEGRAAYQQMQFDSWGILRAQKAPITRRLYEDYENRKAARKHLALTLGRASPAFSMRHAAILLAGTGADSHERFHGAVNAYIGMVENDWFLAEKERYSDDSRDPAKQHTRIWDISSMPIFSYRDTLPGDAVSDALVDVGLIAGWGLLCLGLSYVALLRYDCR